MSIETKTYARNPFYVDAVQVTAENLAEVAVWCGGELRNDDPKAEGKDGPAPQYIHVKVHKPMSPRQEMAYPGDWVLYSGVGFKVYTPRAFAANFAEVATAAKPVTGPARPVTVAPDARKAAKRVSGAPSPASMPKKRKNGNTVAQAIGEEASEKLKKIGVSDPDAVVDVKLEPVQARVLSVEEYIDHLTDETDD